MALTQAHPCVHKPSFAFQRAKPTTVCLDAQCQALEKVSKREVAEAAEEKARSKLDKAKALLEEARALVTVYVVREQRRAHPGGD